METVGGNLEIRGDRGNHDRPDRTRLTGAIVWKPGFKEIGLPRIFILILLPNKISDSTNESDYIQAKTSRDIKTVRANYSQPRDGNDKSLKYVKSTVLFKTVGNLSS